MTPEQHFFALRDLIPGLSGLAILDDDGRQRNDTKKDGLEVHYWNRYEAENYLVTPDVLLGFVIAAYPDLPLFGHHVEELNVELDLLVKERLFENRDADFAVFKSLDTDASRLFWITSTYRINLSDFAEELFRRLATRLGHAMLLRKGELHRLIDHIEPELIVAEVSQKLDALQNLFETSSQSGGLQ